MKKIFKLMCLFAALFTVACDTPEEPKEPQTPENPDAVTMTDIEITDVLDIAAYFKVTVTKMDSFGFVVIKAEEYNAETVTVDYVMKNSGDWIYEDLMRGNYSWDEPMPIPFEEDLEDETDYVVVAAAKNSTSEVLKSAEFTTAKTDMVVEKMQFHPTQVVVESNGTNHVLRMSTILHELQVTLVGREEFGGRYDNSYICNCDEAGCTPENCTCEDCQSIECIQGFIAEGAYFKTLNSDDTWTTYDTIDTTIGNVDFYENVVSGKWEIYGSFCFAMDEVGYSWLTIEIEIPEGVVIDSKVRTEPYEFNLNIVEAEAVKKNNVWNLTLKENKDNTMTFSIDLGEDKAYIPSGTYTVGNQIVGNSMIVNNVATSLASSEMYESKVIVEYDEATEESYVSVDVMVKSGTSVVKVAKAGPFKFYEEVTDSATVYTEGESVNSMLAWTSWDASGYWDIFFSGVHIHMQLYFMTGTDAAEHLPAGRYYLRSSAPSDGSLWIDGGRSYAQPDGTRNQYPFVCDTEDAYIDVTAEYNEEGEFWGHDMNGTLKTANGAYIIHLNFVQANNDKIY